MWSTIDKAGWIVMYVLSFGSWIAVQFFDWTPEPKYLAVTAFMAMQFAASSKLDLFRKVDKPQS